MRVGACWYERDPWERLREVAADPERFMDTYEEWVATAERCLRMVEDAGEAVEKVDAEELIAWCSRQGRPLDAPARAEFVSDRLREAHESG